MAGGEDHPRRPHCDHDTQMHRLKASTMVPARISRRRLMCDTPGNQAYKGHYSATLDMHLNGAVNTKTTETRSKSFRSKVLRVQQHLRVGIADVTVSWLSRCICSKSQRTAWVTPYGKPSAPATMFGVFRLQHNSTRKKMNLHWGGLARARFYGSTRILYVY